VRPAHVKICAAMVGGSLQLGQLRGMIEGGEKPKASPSARVVAESIKITALR